jgi:hypothetical protein
MSLYANVSDIPLIIELAREEHSLSRWADAPFDEGATRQTAEDFLRSFGRTIFLTPNAYLLGMVQPMGFSRKTIAIEYAWYSRDNSGMVLLRAFEAWARNMGADEVVVHDHVSQGRLARILQRRHAYQPVGTTLIRSIGVQHAQAA